MIKRILLAASLAVITQVSSAAVVMIGNPATADQLSKDQAEAIYLAKSKKLPGGMSVTVNELAAGNPLRTEFHQKVTGKSDAQLKSYWSRLVFTGKASAPSEHSSAVAMKAAVAATPGAVGYIDEADVDGSVVVLLKP
ncbi:phosphate ABC transporter substrate-binding protein [Neiella sp. HB171785]|uniref:Phosphate ABC transporter substrate-binding protein n=1 Tax=Neiella litorisoli TaxID=2771431 RepID=A0A8J6QKK8_9GAMM|nr:phosphate ABC transporter substrate-binding protein [Neiella litorisoli]MBD1390984.1 phosphate ABC transporter substrate-binding protein [Neiella litorisoli]